MDITFGLVDHIDRQSRPLHETYDSRLALIEAGDRAGFHAFHLTEHHFTPLGQAPSPNVFLAAASRITTRIRLAPLVLILPLYNPLRLAGEIAMLDHLSKGRYEFAVGRGVSPYELAFYGINHLDAPDMFREGQEVLMAALTQDVVDHRGEYYRFRNVPIALRPYQQPHPPLWTASGSVSGAAHAGRSNMNLVLNHPAERARPLVEAYRAAWEAAGHAAGTPRPKVGLARHVFVADSDAEAEAKLAFGHDGYYEKWVWLWEKFDPRLSDRKTAAAAIRASGVVVAGTPATVRAEIERQIAASGADYFLCRFAYGDLSHADSARSMDLFIREVMPHFQREAA